MRLDQRAAGPLRDVSAEVWIGSPGGVDGPFDLEYFSFSTGSSGFYQAEVPIPKAGVVDLAVRAKSGEANLFGFAVLSAASAPTTPAIGSTAPKVQTATEANPLGTPVLCTRAVSCGMHSVPLDRALESGKPTYLLFASPRLCPSFVCGPVIEELIAFRSASEEAAANFVHVEPYRNERADSLIEAASAWGLQSEPWLFVISGDGRVKDKFEGPVVSELISKAPNA